MNIFLDDERVPEDVKWIKSYPSNIKWNIVRNDVEFFDVIQKAETLNIISLDNDLGYEVEGIHILHRLINKDLDEDFLTQDIKWFVHSKNPVVASQMQSLIINYWKMKFGFPPELIGWVAI